MSMDPELKAKWIKALRSGAYDQGREALVAYGRYCCLGVLFCGLLGKGSLNAQGDPLGLPFPADLQAVGLDNNHSDTLAAINDRELTDWMDVPDPVKDALELDDGHKYKSDFAHIAAAIEAWEDL